MEIVLPQFRSVGWARFSAIESSMGAAEMTTVLESSLASISILAGFLTAVWRQLFAQIARLCADSTRGGMSF